MIPQVIRLNEESHLEKGHAWKRSHSEGHSDDVLEKTKSCDKAVVYRHDITDKRRDHLG